MQQPAPENVDRPGGQQPGAGGNFMGMIFRMVMFWYLMNYFKGNNKTPTTPKMPNLFKKGESVDILVYFNTSSRLSVDLLDREANWQILEVELASSETLRQNITYKIPEPAKHNESLFIHVIGMRSGHDFDPHHGFFGTWTLTHYGPKRKEVKEKNLLFEENTKTEKDKEKEEEAREIVSYWKPKLTVAVVDDFSLHSRETVPPHLRHMWHHNEEEQFYYPMVYFNEFWLLKSHMVELNETVDDLSIELTFATMQPWQIQLITQMEESFKMQQSMGVNSDDETDQFKRILVEGNPILLGITFVVSLLHSVFDFLAFKNDIGFWKNNRSMEGLSARSILINAGCQLVIFLYLMDNETSFVILVSSGIGLLIEFWKVTKAMKVTIEWKHNLPWPHFEDRASYSNSETKKYDAEAMRYMSYVLYPLVIGYSVYALINETHKSWYSWILSSLVGAVYAFGFILMCPQLYLNYKLKSVAHLPWRQLTYKFLNTIIDDLFAFVITMPWLHRLSVFRDDLVFVIYLYQWYVYGVDRTRVNEFGFAQEGPQDGQETETTEQREVEAESNEDTGLRRRHRETVEVGHVEEVEPARLHESSEDKKDQ